MKLVIKWPRRFKNLEELREFFETEDISQRCLDIINGETVNGIILVNFRNEKLAKIKFKR